MSYASQDAEAAKRICDALRAVGVEVWFDQNELVGGDQWDAKIRGQIGSCALFVPIISANTQARLEGYFRLEWKLAAQRTHTMADEMAFLLPVVIDATRDAEAKVPGEFRAVQWTKLPAGETPPAFCTRVQRLLGGSELEAGRPRPAERGGVSTPPKKSFPFLRLVLGGLGILVAGLVLYLIFKPRRSPQEIAQLIAQAEALGAAEAAKATKQAETAAAAPSSLLPVPPTRPEAAAKSVAVLAFKNLSDEKENEYFSDGISEELLNVLAKVPGLKVTARTSSFYFKGKEVPIPEIAQQLGVAYVIEGSVRKQGDKVRITAQLIKAADGFQVWSDDFDRELKDIFAVQDEIAGLIAKNLQIKLVAGDLIGSGTTNPEVLRLYLEGRQAWNLRSAAGYDRAEALLNRALELDPRFARAHAALADVWRIRYSQVRMGGGLANRNSPELAKILAKINEALALDPNCAEAYTSLGAVRGDNWEIEEAVRDLRRAIALNPNYATAHQWLANQLLSLGFVDEAIAEDRLAVELDPLSHRILDNLCWDLTCAGRYREAWDTLERARVLRPNGTQIACYRASLLLQQGKRTEALAEARRLLTPELGADDPPFARYVAMSVLVADGRRAEAEALLPQFPPTGDDRVLALVYLGRMPEALTLLDTVTPGFIQYVLYGTPLREFDAVRNDPVLQAWLAKAGLTEAHARAQAWRAAHPPEIPEAKP